MVSQRVFLVSGANESDFVLLDSHQQKRDEEVVSQLRSSVNVKVLRVNTSSKESINHIKQQIEKKCGERIVNVSSEAARSSITHCFRELKSKFLHPNVAAVTLFLPLLQVVEEGKISKTVDFGPIEFQGLYLIYYSASS
ncbi:unnamed protein product [Adineta ricciae]|uniref:Uncharacterized protein n=1 Tax=Adineta ricciae TaxID=249248 RepID=A0A816CAN7_ADIRI|nr:unnamed protein product [Adineta ricciae]CAF1620948.1 unnamed protein product [Adineta ricciae]